MLEYIIPYLIILVLLIVEYKVDYICIKGRKFKTRELSFCIITLSLLALGIFKYEEYGYDAGTYRLYYFDYINRMLSWKELLQCNIEPGFALISYLITRFTNSYWLYRTIIFILTFVGVSVIIRNWSMNVAFSYLLWCSLGFMSFDMFILRQALAVTFVFLGIKYLNKRNILKFLLFVCLGSIFHLTAFISIAFLPFIMERFQNIKKILYLGYVVVTIIAGEVLLPYVFSIYKRNDYSDIAVAGQGYKLLFIIILFFAITDIILKNVSNRDKLICLNNNKGEQINIQLLYDYSRGAVFVQILAMFFSLFNRVIYFPLIFSVVCVPNIIQLSKERQKYIMIYVLLCMILFVATVLSSSELIPYESVFNRGV